MIMRRPASGHLFGTPAGATLRPWGAVFALLLCCASAVVAAPAGAGDVYRLDSTLGRQVTDRTFVGKVQIVLFGFTYCPDVCPTTLSSIASGLSLLGQDRRDVRVLFISVDPRRDRIAVLREYVRAFGPDVVGLTGTTAQIDTAVGAFRARYAFTPGANGAYDVSHTALVYLIGGRGKLVRTLSPTTRPERYAEEVRHLLHDLRLQ